MPTATRSNRATYLSEQDGAYIGEANTSYGPQPTSAFFTYGVAHRGACICGDSMCGWRVSLEARLTEAKGLPGLENVW